MMGGVINVNINYGRSMICLPLFKPVYEELYAKLSIKYPWKKAWLKTDGWIIELKGKLIL